MTMALHPDMLGSIISKGFPPNPEKKRSRTLDSNDRCDRCSAEARIEVVSEQSGLPLLFCGHHANKYAEPLAEWIVTGTRDLK
jgi:hypothetical protein